MWMVRILIILPVGIENLEKLARIMQISCSSGQGLVNWVDFAQFAVNFENSIYHGANQKMALRISHYLPEWWAFWLLGGCMWILTARMYTNGTDFASFII